MDRTIVRHLLDAMPGFVSGETLADILGVSRVSIWGHLEKLKEHGFVVEAIRNKGYRLVALPPRLDERLLQVFLLRERIHAPLHFLEETDSTNSVGERLLADGAETPAIVVARRQLAGRGRFGRVWHSADGECLTFSLCFRPHLTPAEMQRFTLWMGLSLCRHLEESHGLDVAVKWPNDLMVNQRKLAGMLTEARVDADRTRDLIFGLGININGRLNRWPKEAASRAITVEQACGGPVEINAFSANLIAAALHAYEAFADGSHRAVFDRYWREHDLLANQPVCLTHLGQNHHGTACGITDNGSLRVRLDDGREQTFPAGEVTLSPPRP